MSLFDRLGGAPAITAAAGLFYRKVLADPLLAPSYPAARTSRTRASLELARLGDPATVRAYLCGGAGSAARMRRALLMAGMSLRSIQADEFVPAVIPG
jgi:truncated hemoglobin YjbI